MINPQPGDFGLVAIKGDVGKLIRLGQWLNGDGFNDYEHAFIYIGNNQIVEAMPGGAIISDIDEYSDRAVLWSTGLVPLTTTERAAIVETAIGFVGTPYSFLDYLAIALYRMHFTWLGVEKRVISSKHLICSQLVAQSYYDSGHPITDHPSYLVTPGRLTEYLLSFRHTKKLGTMVQIAGKNSINVQVAGNLNL